MGLVALERVDVDAGERLRPGGGDLLDLDAARGREHQQRLGGAAIECDREVVLTRDRRGDLEPEPLDPVAADVETEDLLGPLGRLLGAVGQLHAAGLAAAARQHLGLDDDGAAELVRRLPRLGRRDGESARRDPEIP